MARIRTVKPEFWTDEDIASLSEPARLLAVGVLNHSDDEGYFKANPMLIKAAVFPLVEPSVSIQCMLNELSNIGYIKVTKGTDGKLYGKVRNFEAHQRVNRPSDSKIKGLCDFSDDSVSNHGALTGGTGNREQGTGNREQDILSSQANDEYEPVVKAWNNFAESKGLKTIQGITKSRATKINTAYKYYRAVKKDLNQKPKEKLDFLLALVDCAEATHRPFHLGVDGGWQMDFDFLLQKKTVEHVAEHGELK